MVCNRTPTKENQHVQNSDCRLCASHDLRTHGNRHVLTRCKDIRQIQREQRDGLQVRTEQESRDRNNDILPLRLHPEVVLKGDACNTRPTLFFSRRNYMGYNDPHYEEIYNV